jgi:dinuclear metal center YbgI/SA1388 family protein
MLTVAAVRRWLGELAPEKWAEEWDNVGLMVGTMKKPVRKIALALDPEPEVVRGAIEEGADLLLTHHPLIFKPIRSLEPDRGAGEALCLAIESGLAIYSLHTNLDLAPGGMAEFLGRKLGLKNLTPACIRGREQLYKLVVFVPKDYKEVVRDAMARQGAGWIGNYSDTSFSASGFGTFRPQEGTAPLIGEWGKLAKVEEERLETIVDESAWPKVREAMLEAHPYEEVAYDLYPLAEPKGRALAFARIGTIPPLPLHSWAEAVAKSLGTQVHYAGDPGLPVRKVAVIPGSGGSLWQGVASADCLVTGEIGYHQLLALKQAGRAGIQVGHYSSEACFVELMEEFLAPRVREAGVELTIIKQGPLWQAAGYGRRVGDGKAPL